MRAIPGLAAQPAEPAARTLDAAGRKEFAQRYRELQEQLDNPADRLAVMDAQGIECAVNYAALPGIEVEFEDDFDGLYANLIALNRYLGTEWGLQLRGPPVHAAVHLLRRSRGRAAAARGDHEDRDAEGHPDVERAVDAHVAVPPRERPVLVDLQRSRDQALHPPRHRHPLRRAGARVERGRGDARRHGRVPVGLLLRRPPGDGDGRRRDPAGLVRPVPEDAAAALRAGHGVGAVHRSASSTTRSSWDGARRGARSTDASERVLPGALLRRAVPGGERRPGDRGDRHRADRVRFRLPARRRACPSPAST